MGLGKIDDGIFTNYCAHLPLTKFEDKTDKPVGVKRVATSELSCSGRAYQTYESKKRNLPGKDKVSGMNSI